DGGLMISWQTDNGPIWILLLAVGYLVFCSLGCGALGDIWPLTPMEGGERGTAAPATRETIACALVDLSPDVRSKPTKLRLPEYDDRFRRGSFFDNFAFARATRFSILCIKWSCLVGFGRL